MLTLSGPPASASVVGPDLRLGLLPHHQPLLEPMGRLEMLRLSPSGLKPQVGERKVGNFRANRRAPTPNTFRPPMRTSTLGRMHLDVRNLPGRPQIKGQSRDSDSLDPPILTADNRIATQWDFPPAASPSQRCFPPAPSPLLCTIGC